MSPASRRWCAAKILLFLAKVRTDLTHSLIRGGSPAALRHPSPFPISAGDLSVPQQDGVSLTVLGEHVRGLQPLMCPGGIPLSRASAGKGLGGGAMGSGDLERAAFLAWGGMRLFNPTSVCWVPSIDALGSPRCGWDQPWGLAVPSPIIRVHSASPACPGTLRSRTVLSAVVCAGEKQGGGEERGGRGRERGRILLPFQPSGCLVLLLER